MIVDDSVVVFPMSRDRINRDGLRQHFADNHRMLVRDGRRGGQRRADDRADAGSVDCTDRTSDHRADRGASKRSAHSPDGAVVVLRDGEGRDRYGGARTAMRKAS